MISEDEYLIRAWTAEDLPRLMAIEKACQQTPWPVQVFNRCLDVKYPGWILQSKKKQEIVGFLLVSLAAGDCHILNINIHPNFQRQGLGRRLMSKALQWAKDKAVMFVYLEVRRSNIGALRLYRSLDFTEIGERKNYYISPAGNEDALVLARDMRLDD